jgi:3-deoxy-D-manno-octulosonic-acid transferase
MLTFIYNILIYSYRQLIGFYSIFDQKAGKWIKGRRDIFEALKKENFHQTIWFHCASVGEFEQGYPLLLRLKQRYAESTFLVTFFSPSGYDFTKKRYDDFLIYYLPLDTKKNAIRFLEIIQPKAVFFIKYEFWAHYLRQLNYRKIPTFLVSGIFRKDQIFFTWYGQLHRAMLSCFTHLFLQNEESKSLLQTINITSTSVFGDTRFDRVIDLRKSAFDDEIINHFCNGAKIFVAGSVWVSDQPVLEKIIGALPSDWKIMIAPHEIHNYSSNWLHEKIEFYTQYNKSQSRILMINILGILSKLYRKADLVYVGGGYGKGIHNILEAVVYEIPILIGPNHQKFNEALELIDLGITFDSSLKTSEMVVDKLLNDKEFYDSVAEKARSYMNSHTNVSAKIEVFISDTKLIP